MSMTLRIADVEHACTVLLRAVASRQGPEVDLAQVENVHDYYWSIDLRPAYGMVDPCPPPDAGVVSDDLEEIVHALSDEDLDLQLWHALDHLAGVIRLLAYLELPAG